MSNLTQALQVFTVLQCTLTLLFPASSCLREVIVHQTLSGGLCLEALGWCKHQFLFGGTWPQVGKISVSVLSLYAEEVCASCLSCHRAGSFSQRLVKVGHSQCLTLLVFKRPQLKSCWKGGTLFKRSENLEPQLEPQSEPHFKINKFQEQQIKFNGMRVTDWWSVPENSNWWTIAVQRGESQQAQHLNSTSVILSPRPKFECHFNLINSQVKNCNGQFF